MQNDKLVAMANQIASFFHPYPEADAVAGIDDHLKSFWTPAMRRALAQRLDAGAGGIDKLVVMALTRPHMAAAGDSPIVKEVKGPGELGQAASDAG
jgi:formate dehydrogenase subunit delta